MANAEATWHRTTKRGVSLESIMSFTLDDLIKKCPDCSGSGKRSQEPSIGGHRSFGRHTVTHPMYIGSDDCARCWGTGRWELTEAGEAIADLLKILNKRGQI